MNIKIKKIIDIFSCAGVLLFPSIFVISLFIGSIKAENSNNFIVLLVFSVVIFIPSILWIVARNYKKLDNYVGRGKLFSDRRQFYFGARVVVFIIIIILITYSKR